MFAENVQTKRCQLNVKVCSFYKKVQCGTCSVCEYYVHVDCSDLAVSDCKEAATYVANMETVSFWEKAFSHSFAMCLVLWKKQNSAPILAQRNKLSSRIYLWNKQEQKNQPENWTFTFNRKPFLWCLGMKKLVEFNGNSYETGKGEAELLLSALYILHCWVFSKVTVKFPHCKCHLLSESKYFWWLIKKNIDKVLSQPEIIIFRRTPFNTITCVKAIFRKNRNALYVEKHAVQLNV